MGNPVISQTIKEILEEYELDPKEALWPCHKNYIIRHKAVEELAQKANITTELVQVVRSDVNNVALHVIGKKGDVVEWSIGEASPQNCQNNYYFAMAEKRAKDRVILKLIGLAGHVYADPDIADAENTNEEGERDVFNTSKEYQASRQLIEKFEEAKNIIDLDNARERNMGFIEQLVKKDDHQNLSLINSVYDRRREQLSL
tara:strand:+ start:1497 stop:2099 length:603 start_codon:yes stop_codon:yes gene_type:complete